MDKVTLSILVLSMGLFDRLFGNKKKEVGETVDSQSQEDRQEAPHHQSL